MKKSCVFFICLLLFFGCAGVAVEISGGYCHLGLAVLMVNDGDIDQASNDFDFYKSIVDPGGSPKDDLEIMGLVENVDYEWNTFQHNDIDAYLENSWQIGMIINTDTGHALYVADIQQEKHCGDYTIMAIETTGGFELIEFSTDGTTIKTGTYKNVKIGHFCGFKRLSS